MVESASICFRIGTPQWMPKTRHRALLDLFHRHRGVTDEITYFTSETHPPLPLPVVRDRVRLLADRVAEARERGWRAGINILSTIGHHEENLPHSLNEPYQRAMNSHGQVCRGVYCPNDDRFREYVRETYRLMAQAEPDYLWIDDDVRLMGHTPIRETCFCDTCLHQFAEETGRAWTREELRQAFVTGSLVERLCLRRSWLEHNRSTIARLFALIERTVHDVAPGLELGFMTGERFYEGYDFDRWANVLAGPGLVPVRWRPGGGTYSDVRLDDILDKAHQIGRQIALLPPDVRVIQSEIENFPYQLLKKSARATALEAAAYIAAGCTGAAYNVLSQHAEPLDEYGPLVERLLAARPFLDRLAAAAERSPCVGVGSGWTKDSFAACALDAGDWFGGGSVPGTDHVSELYRIGIPPSYRPATGDGPPPSVSALTHDAPRAMGDEAIRRILSAGCYLDAPALACLNDMGFGDLTGFGVGALHNADCIEELWEHPLNEPFAGRRRNTRQSFWPEAAYELVPREGAQPLARIVNYAGEEVAACALGVYENELGGRVAVGGYSPWTFLQSFSAASRIKTLMRWLSRDTLPGYVASYHRITLWLRQPESGRRVVAVLLNASLDDADGVTIALRTSSREVLVSDESCRESRAAAQGRGGEYETFALPLMPPWSMLLVEG